MQEFDGTFAGIFDCIFLLYILLKLVGFSLITYSLKTINRFSSFKLVCKKLSGTSFLLKYKNITIPNIVIHTILQAGLTISKGGTMVDPLGMNLIAS